MVDAPGEPGQAPRWLPVGKSGVGRSLGDDARVWFTLGHGILNEIAYPRIEQTAVRDFGLIVTDGEALFAEERRHCDAEVSPVAPGIPAYRITGTHEGGRFRLRKRLIADPGRPAVLLHVTIEDLRPGPEAGSEAGPPLRVHALLAPHLANAGGSGNAWTGDYKGQEMLFAEAQGTAIALAASCGWRARSAGYAGISDGWQDLSRHRQMRWQYERALNGNVALTGELDLRDGADGRSEAFVVCLAFGRIWTEAAMRARAALLDPFEALEARYVAGWTGWLDGLPPSPFPLQRNSLMVLRSHQCPSLPGACIGSLGVPWAALQDSDEPSASHLARARDVVACAVALLAAGDPGGLEPALSYLQTVQEADGHWARNFWLDGMTAWQGLQPDETARPVLLADLARRGGWLDDAGVARFWPMVRAAALSLVRHDPLAGHDRWGRDDGSRPQTLGATVAALLAAADWAGAAGDAALRRLLQDTADCIHELLLQLLDEPGAEPDPDIVALVRLGVLAPDDPRLRRALAGVDRALRVAGPGGPAWCARGEAGRAPRPVLALERAMLAVASGEPEQARALLDSAEACAGAGGMLPERADGPGGRGGTVMPHLWTHAEHVTLLRAIEEGRLFDRPPQPGLRYAASAPPRIARWRHESEPDRMPRGRTLRIELPMAADLHWSSDRWGLVQDTPVTEAGPGLFVAELPTADLAPGHVVVFTWRERDSGAWLGHDHHVTVR